MMRHEPLVQVTERGLYCKAGDFYIDPWRPVDYAVVTHAHADHARRGSRNYLTATDGEQVLRTRMLDDARIETIEYGRSICRNGVTLSLHPAGHVLGSSQIRVEHRGEVWVISGDYKIQPDRTCKPFEPIRCHKFISECTFGLPIYRWDLEEDLFHQINQWWRSNQHDSRPSIIFSYALGKAQRLIAGVDSSIGPIYCHGAVEQVNRDYRQSGVALPNTQLVSDAKDRSEFLKALIIAPPSANGTTWMRRFPNASKAFASGWMTVRGARRRRAVDRGFILSDHADWNGLIQAIEATKAEQVLLTHGQTDVMVRWLKETRSLDASRLETQFQGELDEETTTEQVSNPSESKHIHEVSGQD